MTAKPRSADRSDSVDEVCDRFEDALQQGQCPDLAQYLALAGSAADSALPDLAALELFYRLVAGEAVTAQDYFETYPVLRADAVVAVRLVHAEYRAAAKLDPAVAESDFRHRYPDLADKPEWRKGPWSAHRETTLSRAAGREQIPGLLDAPDPDHPDDLGKLGEYRILEVLGRGAMGIVYRAQDPELNRDVAVKVLTQGWSATGSTAAGRRFLAEAQITGQLQHPGIPAVYRIGFRSDGRPYLVMKFIKGRTLEVLLKERPNPSVNRGQFLAVFEQLCQAVGYAHAHRVIHRDLKPSNVMIGAFGEVQVTDWGLAKALTPDPSSPPDEFAEDRDSITLIRPQRGTGEVTQVGSVLGTPAYMAPEQAIGAVNQLDAQTDVFGLGAVLCVILTGTPPYVGADAESTRQSAARAQLVDAFARLDASGAEPELVALCKSCLSVDKSHRPIDAGQVAATVAQLRAASGERARLAEVERERAMVREAEGRKRRRLATGLVAMIGLALSTGMATTYLKYRGEAAQLAIAQDLREKLESRRDRTFTVLADMTSESTGDSLTRQLTVTEDQRKFLTNVLSYYQEFTDETATDERTRTRTAEAAYQVGMIQGRLGNKTASAAAFVRAREEYQRLAQDFPQNLEYRRNQARSHNNLGHQYRDLDKQDDAERAYREALALQERLVAEESQNPTYRLELARSHNSLGVLYERRGQSTQATAEYLVAQRIQTALVAEDARNPKFRQELATSHNNLGLCLGRQGKREEAREQYLEALLLQKGLVAEFRDVPAYSQELARSYNNLGILLTTDPGKSLDAEAQHREALTLRENLVADYPGVPAFRSELADTHTHLGILLATHLGKATDAERAFRMAVTHRERLIASVPSDLGYRQNLARSYSNLGSLLRNLKQWKPAEDEYRKALVLRESLATDDAKYRSDLIKTAYDCACLYAAMSTQEEDQKWTYGTRAMQMLQKAVTTGWSDVAHLKKDPDLDPLRDRPDFQKLLAELEEQHPAKN